MLLTPVVLTLAGQLRLGRMLFACTAVWLANTASLFLPVSNLTNLLALTRLPDGRVPAFRSLTWPAAVACTVVTVVALALFFRRSLRGSYVLGDACAIGSPARARRGSRSSGWRAWGRSAPTCSPTCRPTSRSSRPRSTTPYGWSPCSWA